MNDYDIHDYNPSDYGQVTDALCDLLRDRGFIRGEQVRVRCSTLDEMIAQGSNITTARERADSATADFERQALRVEGEIAVCQARLRFLDHLALTAKAGV